MKGKSALFIALAVVFLSVSVVLRVMAVQEEQKYKKELWGKAWYFGEEFIVYRCADGKTYAFYDASGRLCYLGTVMVFGVPYPNLEVFVDSSATLKTSSIGTGTAGVVCFTVVAIQKKRKVW